MAALDGCLSVVWALVESLNCLRYCVQTVLCLELLLNRQDHLYEGLAVLEAAEVEVFGSDGSQFGDGCSSPVLLCASRSKEQHCRIVLGGLCTSHQEGLCVTCCSSLEPDQGRIRQRLPVSRNPSLRGRV